MFAPKHQIIRRYAPLGLLVLFILGLAGVFGAASAVSEAGGRAFLPFTTGFVPAFTITPVGEGFNEVTAITYAPGDIAGDGRLFVIERGGRVKLLYPDGRVTLFLEISDRVISAPGEYGMYDLAFHPGYTDPLSPGYGFFYVTYNGRHMGQVRFFISRFQISSDENLADPDSEAWLLKEEQSFSWHKGGELDFDPSGSYLYAGLGDDRQPLLAQSLRSPKGKIIRLKVDDVPATATGDATTYLSEEIWALGLRNPYRFDVDPPSGQIFVGEVGDLLWEEIDLISLQGSFANFGWPCMEGPEIIPPYASYAECENTAGFRAPIAYYAHTEGRCAIIGGKVYRPVANPADGRFVYGDLCSRELFALSSSGGMWHTERLGALDTPDLLTTLGEDARGNLLAGTTASSGPIYRLIIP